MKMRAGLIVVATVTLAVVWFATVGWRVRQTPDGAGLGWLLATVGFAVLQTVDLILLAVGRHPAALVVRPGVFVAPPAYRRAAVHGSTLLAGGLVAATAAWIVRVDGPIILAVALLVIPCLTIPLALAWLRVVFRDQLRVELRPEGLWIFHGRTALAVPWEAIAKDPYPRQDLLRVIRITIGRPELVPSRKRRRAVLLPRYLAVDPTFLTATVTHYLFRPEHRAAIGTPEEYARMKAALTERLAAQSARATPR
jgi:hypothetical protein